MTHAWRDTGENSRWMQMTSPNTIGIWDCTEAFLARRGGILFSYRPQTWQSSSTSWHWGFQSPGICRNLSSLESKALTISWPALLIISFPRRQSKRSRDSLRTQFWQKPVGKMEMIGTLGESSHAVSEFDLNSVLPMQTQMVLMSRKTGKKPKKPACHTGTRWQALNLKQRL